MGNAGKGGKGKLSVDDAVTCWKTTTTTMKLADDDDDMDEDLLKLFDLEELEGYLAELMDDIAAKDKTVKEGTYEQLLQKLQPSAALRLLNFLGLGGRSTRSCDRCRRCSWWGGRIRTIKRGGCCRQRRSRGRYCQGWRRCVGRSWKRRGSSWRMRAARVDRVPLAAQSEWRMNGSIYECIDIT